MLSVRVFAAALCALGCAALQAQPAGEGALDLYQRRYENRLQLSTPSPGSLFAANSYLTDMARDPLAAQVGDLVTVVVAEQASAVSAGQTQQERKSAADHSISKLLGPLNPMGALSNLATQGGDSHLRGQGSTSRRTTVSAVVTAYVVDVMPNGNLVIEGVKEVAVNSERQLVWLKGVLRPADLRPDNSVGSDRVALMDLRVNGQGVVNDAIRRPNALYRFFQKILPF